MRFEDFAARKMLDNSQQAEYLTEREKQLIGLAVALTRGCVHCTGGRISRALESGISQEAIIQAIDIAAAVNASVTTSVALQGFQKEELDGVPGGEI